GPTGSGKSTTLTAMIDLINRTKQDHVVTVEDPIEFVHTSQRSLIHQREVGADTTSFAEALRRVLRQDPDVILIGELRDPESISTALTAAETGHLVLSTLHTQGAAKSINRIVDAFPAHQQNQVRSQLGDTLQGVISQTLLPKAQGGGRVIATEVLVSTPAVANLVRENQIAQLYNAMQAGEGHGMHTLDQSLKTLVESGDVAASLARHYLTDPHALDGVRVRPRDYDAEAWLGGNADPAPPSDDWIL
ncbi:MAG TPA: type IV pili twitching motility protein PilT, partial [Microbacterium sp.]|nr:type IV pili twitching motility protein PilT [Microbacterium sp.]